MKPVANPVSEFDAEKFADYVTKWQSALNLKDWRITRSRRKTRNMADVKIFIPDRLATWTIGSSFGGAKVDDYNLEATAAHEMLHVLLAELIDIAEATGHTQEQVWAAEHRIINTLLHLLVQKGE